MIQFSVNTILLCNIINVSGGYVFIRQRMLVSGRQMLIVNAALKAKAWTFEATGAKAKAKTIKIGLEAKAWPRGLHHWSKYL